MIQTIKTCCIFFLLLSSFFAVFAQKESSEKKDTVAEHASEKKKVAWKDPETGAIDISEMIYNADGFIPIPIIVTEPAIGYGGGLALLYIQPQKKKYKQYVPPNISGVAGMATDNSTWAAGLFHFQVWGPDRLRYLGVVGKPSIHIDFYGNNNEYLSQNPVELFMDSWAVVQRAQVRIKDTHLFIGGSYIYVNSELSVDTLPDKPIVNKILNKLNGQSTISMIQPIINWDSRNTIFTPTTGVNTGIIFSYNAAWLGGGEDFYELTPYYLGYYPLSKKVYTGWRFNASFMLGDAPYYALPFIQLRGVPAMQYQSNNTMLVETEWRFVVYNRWSVDVFTGTGKAFTSFNEFENAVLVYNYGLGFRYDIAHAFGLDVGLDFAWSNNGEFAFYIIFGSAWKN